MSATQQVVPAAIARADGLARADRLLTLVLEAVTAGLVVAEIVILFAGVVARYVFHQPLIWSDELASMLFLWLAMLGAVMALRRDEHMRMTALVDRAGAPLRRLFDDLALAAALAFLIAILAASLDYARNEAIVSIMSLRSVDGLARRGDAGRHRADDRHPRCCGSIATRCRGRSSPLGVVGAVVRGVLAAASAAAATWAISTC